jgi:radical SAM protein with 4Fe4S-binding SPASM domain
MCRRWEMMRLSDLFRTKPLDVALKPGTYKFDGAGDLSHHRFHLRVDNEGSGVLLVDASKLIFLNGTGLDYVRCALEGKDDVETFRYLKERYKGLKREVVKAHYSDVKERLTRYVHGEADVIRTIGSESPSIGSDRLDAPYRMDLALTYRCQNDCSHCYNESKDKNELAVEQWTAVIDKLWDIGVPHIVFTGGEPTLYPDLVRLVARSEEHGQVTGLISNGRGLDRPGFLHELVRVGLDHVQITVLSADPETHDRLVGSAGAFDETISGVKAALKEDMYVSTNTTIMRSTLAGIEDTMRYLVGIGVRNIAFNSIIRSGKGTEAEGVSYEELASVLSRVKAIASETGINLIWYSPTPYCELNPINLGLGIKQCTACSLNMAIEPDGTVLPCQSYYEPLGNILSDPWDSIWNNRLCKDIRERKYVGEECPDCNLLQVCGGGCPLSWKHGDYVCLDRHSSM